MRGLPTLADLHAASAEDFAGALAPLFEGAPRFLRRLAQERPFATWEALFDAARRVALAMPEHEQVELLDAHPRIGAAPAMMSELSRREQGVEPQRGDLAQRLEALNERYERRFGFRYVVFVAGRSRDEIVPLLEAALLGHRDAELRRGLVDVVSIAEDRFRTLDARPPAPTIGR